jgi:hypothetical protein
MDRYIRYLRLVDWLRVRYADEAGLIVEIGNTPSAFTRIERIAFRKIILGEAV